MLQPGAVVAGKYRVERLLGAGGMGCVYVATNTVIAKTVALKVMSGGFSERADAVERFFREAMSASRVRHPAIVQIYDAGAHDGAPWMAMELLEGESLAQRIERGPIDIAEVRAIFVPVLSALDAVHAQGIVHRDLKPDNIFLERLADGRVQPKLLDFGIAKTADGLNKLTQTGAVMGTAHYLAPEQARDSSTVDPRTDLYAIGVVLYEALSGTMPHVASTLPELISKLITEDPVPLRQVAPGVPDELARAVHWCLARDPAARPQRASELCAYLEQVLAALPSARAHTGPGDATAGAALAALHPTAPLSPGGWAPPAPISSPNAWAPSAPTSSPGGWASHGPASAPAGWSPTAPLPPPPTRHSSNRALFWILGLVGLITICSIGAPIVISVVAMAGSMAAFAGAGGPGGGGFASSSRFPRIWEQWRAPFFVDVNADGHADVVGWQQQVIASDTHELLCAYDGRDGTERWCADVGEQDDLSDTETVLVGSHLVYFDHRGAATAFRVATGEALDWSASVRGEPEEVCVLGDDRVAVRTPDHLWSILTVSRGRTELAGETMPAGCAPVPTATPPRSLSTRVWSATWTKLGPVDRPRRLDELSVRESWRGPTGDVFLIGVQREGARRAGVVGRMPARPPAWAPGMALEPNGDVRNRPDWVEVVPTDPIRAQAQAPEAVAITDDVAFVSYELTARGDVPRRLAAFRMSDGGRLWDVGMPDARGQSAWYVMADAHLVLVCTDQVLVAYDRQSGERRFQIGERYR